MKELTTTQAEIVAVVQVDNCSNCGLNIKKCIKARRGYKCSRMSRTVR